ncbi:hypothetical protein [Methylobacterium sp. NFXW15]|uniref:hypothetical protein n=1 Tax=Methylobacterium sp. NFXW15 TaxID=2819512 RepID=UPI003CF3D0C8
MPVKRPFPVDPVITAIAIGYRNQAQDLIADQVLPRVPVLGERYKWTEYPLAEHFTVPDTEVGRRGRVNRVEFSGVERTRGTQDYGLEDAIPISDINEAEGQRRRGLGLIDPEKISAEGLTDLVLLDREVRVAAVAQNPDNYAPTRSTSTACATWRAWSGACAARPTAGHVRPATTPSTTRGTTSHERAALPHRRLRGRTDRPEPAGLQVRRAGGDRRASALRR